jgi:serine/threonine protein kinase/formylglycine-generating enzyme required for sulfatase activity
MEREDQELREQIGDYRIEGLLGRGGMGEVYRGVQDSLHREVAIKVLRPSAITPDGLRRFEYEAEILARLDHPNIAKIFQAGFAGSSRRPYIAMELVQGSDILTHCEEHGFDVRQKLQLFESVCAGVEHAHRNGIVHRDLKPQNILVSADGRPRILDFGLARPTASEAGNQTPGQTQEGSVVGSLDWMSPEQARGDIQAIDVRSDVYSLGILFFSMLCGELPYIVSEVAPWEAVRIISEKDPRRLGRVRSELRGDLDAIAAMALEKEPRRRYPSAGALGRDVKRFLEYQPVEARSWSTSYQLWKFGQRHRATVIALGIALLALITGTLLAIVGLMSARTETENANWERERAHEERARANQGRVRAEQRAKQVLRLSDVERLRDLGEKAEQLWPRRPDTIAGLEAWIDGAEELRGRLDEHRFSCETLRGSPGTKKASLASRSSELTRYEKGWWLETLEALVLDLESFLDPEAGMLADVQRRLELASSMEQKTVDDCAEDWEAAIAEVFDHPAYDGLELAPQLGMIPLGPDPKSGLWEFLLWESGETPQREEESGGWIVTGESGIILVLLPGGIFNMGATQAARGPNYDPEAESVEGPVHAVVLAPFFLSKYEMTQGQWLRLMGENPSYYGVEEEAPLARPVEHVSWTSCKEALFRLGLQFPTEAQWEYACRAGTDTPWSSGETKQSLQAAANLGDASYAVRHKTAVEIEHWNDGYSVPAPVGRLAANDFGLHDVHGNVREWCHDSWTSYATSPGAGDGLRLDDPAALRVSRGGCFVNRAINARSASRRSHPPQIRLSELGLRAAARVVR